MRSRIATILIQYAGYALTGSLVLFSVVAAAGCWVLTLMGLPGNWCLLLLAFIHDWLFAFEGRLALGWPVIGALAVLAVVGEVIEFAAGALGVRKTGGSRRSAAAALVGSIAGGIVGAAVGLPIPVIGSVIGVLLFAGLGALVGAALGEYSVRRELKGSLKVGVAAFLGRLFGSIGKTIIGAVMVALFLISLIA